MYSLNTMTNIIFEQILFKNVIKRVNNYLKIPGLSLDENDKERSIMQRLNNRWFFCINILCVFLNIVSQITWLVQRSYTWLTLNDLTYSGPCISLCVLGFVKSYYFMKNTPNTHKLISTLNTLYNDVINIGPEGKKKNETNLQRQIKFLNTALNTLTLLDSLGIIAFGVGPIIMSISQYYTTGSLKLLLPFFLVYPFDPFVISVWPFAYIHQIWSAILAVFTVLGPDSFFYSSCVLLNIKFFQLKQEIETIFDKDVVKTNVKFKLGSAINRHKQLLRCVELLEKIYSESTLCNLLTSSLLICFTGFNVMAYDNMFLMAPFIAFLFMVTGQIYLLCYYGDLIQKSSAELSDAVYNCGWYGVKVNMVKNLMIFFARAQKPCKLTAFGYTDINIASFTRIMSTSWSYFALLLSLHRNH